jgi:hypothetical protein
VRLEIIFMIWRLINTLIIIIINLGLKHKTNATFMDGKLYNDLSLIGLNPHMSGSSICVTSVRGQEIGT